MKLACFLRLSLPLFFSVSLVNGQAPSPAKPAQPSAPAATPGASSPNLLEQANDPVVITAGSQKVTKSEYEQFIAALPPQIQKEARGPNKRKVAEQYAELRLLAGEARKRKVDQKPEVKTQLEFQTDQFLAATFFRDLQASVPVDEATVKAYYDEHKAQYEQVKAKHILIRFQGSQVPVRDGGKEMSEAEALVKAQEVKKKLDGGGDFVALAKTESDDTGTGAQGGALGAFFSRGQMVPEFDTAAFALPVGKVSDPVKSKFGYHLILVDEKKSQPLEEVKPEIEKQMRPELAKKQVEGIKQATPIVIDNGYFGQ